MNEEISVEEPELEIPPVLDILFQDEHIVAIDKPAGLFVHRSYLDRREKYFVLQLLRDQIGQYVYPLHRLDRPTSGVLVFGLSKEVAQIVGQQFTNREVKKTYLALTRGHLLGEGIVDYALKEKLDKIADNKASKNKPAQEALSAYASLANATLQIPLGKFPSVRYSLVKMEPKTGRKHQLRRHLAHLRHPILGDINYGDNKQNPFFGKHFGFKRLMLIAKKIEFTHPITKECITIEADLDQEWLSVFEKLNWSKSLANV